MNKDIIKGKRLQPVKDAQQMIRELICDQMRSSAQRFAMDLFAD